MAVAFIADRRAFIHGGREASIAKIRHRITIVMAIFIAAFLSIGIRLADLSLFHPGLRSSRRNTALGLIGRAEITDRNGAVLASSLDGYTIAVHPAKLIGDPQKIAARLAAILPARSVASIYRDLVDRGRFRYIARNVLPSQAWQINALGDPGIEIEREAHRVYPNAQFAAHILGYTDIDGVGRAGIEQQFNDRLTRPTLRDQPLALSLDARVQEALERELSAAMVKHRAIGASGVILDVHTGEVLAMASLPQPDPNLPAVAPAAARFNRATLGVYELGSVFKAMTIAMALDCGVIKSMADRYDASAPLQVGRFRIHDDHAKNRWLTVPEIFAYSSNIGAARIARDIGAARQRAYLTSLGLLSPVQLELPERGRPLYPREWGDIATMTVGFGHGIAVTPLHLATAYAALVNGGIWRPATLLKVNEGQRRPGHRIFSADTSRMMRALMRLVVTQGTGKEADANGYRVGGKTGTAEKPEGGRYNRHALISTFAGAFPIDDPRYVIVATVDEPKGTQDTFGYATGGWISAPIVRRVVRAIGPMLGIYPDVDREIDLSSVLPYLAEPDGQGARAKTMINAQPKRPVT